jgi:hypothetical protein
MSSGGVKVGLSSGVDRAASPLLAPSAPTALAGLWNVRKLGAPPCLCPSDVALRLA